MIKQEQALAEARKYMKHDPLCAVVGGYDHGCTCGMQAAADALAALQPTEQPEAAQDDLNKAADRVVIANATGNPDLYHDAVAALLKVVRQAAKRDALTQTRAEVTDEEIDAVWHEARTGNHGDTTIELIRWFARALLSQSSGQKG